MSFLLATASRLDRLFATQAAPAFAPVALAAAALLALAACGTPRPDERAAAPGQAAPAEDAAQAASEQQTAALAERLIARTDSLFRTVDLLSGSEKRRLRRYLQPQHIVRARRLGLGPVADRRAAAQLWSPGTREPEAARLFTNSYYIVDPSMSFGVPVVVPSTAHLLERLGRRFQERLLREGLPPYRFLITSVLRTGQDQAALRGGNVNATPGTSTHEYGTTFDIYYRWFQYAAAHDVRREAVLAPMDSTRRAAIDVTALRRRLYAAYMEFGKSYASRIEAVLGRAILDMQDDGLLLATYERRQPVFHLTVARSIEAPEEPFDPRAALADSVVAGVAPAP